MKIYANEFGLMTNMTATPIYGKNLKKTSPELTDHWPQNWYVALGTQVYQDCSTDDLGLTLTFLARLDKVQVELLYYLWRRHWRGCWRWRRHPR